MVNKKTALITGITGQDGASLASQLIQDGWNVYGGFRRASTNKMWRLEYLGIKDKVRLVECHLNEAQNLIEILRDIKPSEVYHLAGESFVSDSFKYPGVTLDVNTHGVVNMLDAIRLSVPEAKLFFASSSEVFGRNEHSNALDENSSFLPSNPYGISKLAAQNFIRLYRERYKLFACSGILFNHEGPIRGRQYVTRKITYNLARIKHDGGKEFELGNMNTSRDWGSAEDYTFAMRKMLLNTEADDYVVATGRLTTVRDFLKIAAIAAGFDPVFDGEGIDEKCIDKKSNKILASVSEKYFRPQDTPPLLGNPEKIKKELDWEGSRSIEKTIEIMVQADIDRWKKGITNV